MAPTDITGFSFGAKNSAGSTGSETSQNQSGSPNSDSESKDDSGTEKVSTKGTSTDVKEPETVDSQAPNHTNNATNEDISKSGSDSKGTNRLFNFTYTA